MKKFLAVLLAGMMLVAMCSGCGQDTAVNEEDNRIVITVSDYPVESKPEQREIFDQKIAAFEALHPDIKVVGDTYTYGMDTFITKAASGQLPTFYRAHFTEIDKIVSAGYAADLTEAMVARGYDSQMSEQIKDFVTRDGKIYAVPQNAYYTSLVINIPLFEQAGLMNEDGTPKMPQTYDELREMSEIIKEKTGQSGFGFPTVNNGGGWRFMNIAWSYGTSFMKQENDKWIATFDTPECIEALQYVKDLKWKYNVMPDNALIDGTEIQKQYATNQLAMMYSASDNNLGGVVDNYGMSKDDIAIATPPAGPAGKVVQMGGAVMFVNPNATKEQIDACMEWAKFQGWTPEITEDMKNNLEIDFKQDYDDNHIVGIKGLRVWDSPEFQETYDSIMNKYINVDMRLFEDFNNPENVELRPEEPMYCQELYKALDAVIQEVLTNEDADPAELLKKANADFQTNFLDNAE